MALTDPEMFALRFYLGYSDGRVGYNYGANQFLKGNVDALSPAGEDRLRGLIRQAEALSAKISEATDCLSVRQIDGATFNAPSLVLGTLREEGKATVRSMARIVGVPAAPEGPFGRLDPTTTTRRA